MSLCVIPLITTMNKSINGCWLNAVLMNFAAGLQQRYLLVI